MNGRPLSELVLALRREGLVAQGPTSSVSLSGLTADSRSVASGNAFIAVRGSQSDGHQFVADAVKRGAAALVVEQPMGSGVPEIVVVDARRAAIAAGRFWYGDPARKLCLIGITGTNGKTTTTALVRHLFNGEGKAGSIGTLGAFDGLGKPVDSTAGSLTTPGPIDLQATLATMVARGVTHVAMETSSHSLDQGRLDGLCFHAGIFTNLTRDHLDYHRTMESYLAAKLRLSGYLGLEGWEIVNQDDPAWAALPLRSRRLSYGFTTGSQVSATDIQQDHSGSRFKLSAPQGDEHVTLPLLGEFNIHNALAAAATALALGQSVARVAAGLTAAPQVPGRMERIVERPCVVLRDYAHTPDALERALQSLRPLTPGRLIVVFGCGGDRDRGKRPVMGRIAATLSDLAIVTSDNPRTEDPDAIIADVEQGMGSASYLRMVDRRDAIRAALDAGRTGDTILLAGKGHETYQVVGTTKLPFDEPEIVRKIVSGER